LLRHFTQVRAAARHSVPSSHLQNGGAVTDLQQQLGHAELATTQIYAAAISGRRRATVMALEFGGGTGRASA
jgi:site-specific recombinase XerD